MKIRNLTYLFFLFILSGTSFGQAISVADSASESKVLFRKEKSFFAMIHTSGWGIGYTTAKNITAYKKKFIEFEFTGINDPKKIKTIYPDADNSAKSYVYGKENSLYVLRVGYGFQKVINSKPYWGGVELRFLYEGGLSLGILKPVYLYIIDDTASNTSLISIQKYDPTKDYTDNIYGGAPFFQGLSEIQFVPGIFTKIGFNFEYGTFHNTIKAVELGIVVDAYPKPMPLMAFNPNKSIFFNLYLSFHLGWKNNQM